MVFAVSNTAHHSFVIGLIAVATVLLHGQNIEPSKFEVASIKRTPPGVRGMTIYNPTPTRFAAQAITAKALIAYAYDVREFQISGAAGWIASDQYDIVAKPQGDASSEHVMAMARTLLAERFNLKLHRESKTMPVFALVVAKGGSKLRPVTGTGPEVRGGRGSLTCKNVTMGMLAAQLAGRVLERPVLDQTLIEGTFDINLDWTPDSGPNFGPSIFTALEEQLGLKLEATRGPIDVLVIDHIERPSAN